MTGVIEALRLAVAALFANKLRGSLTTLGVIIGVATVMVISAVIAGLDAGFATQIEGIGSNVLYVQKYPWMPTQDWWNLRNRKNIGWDEYNAVAAQAKTVETVAPAVYAPARLTYGGRWLEGVAVTGTTESYRDVIGLDPARGRFLVRPDVHYRKAHCVIGAGIAKDLFGSEGALGKRIKIAGLPYLVVGILPEQGEILGFDRDTQVYIPIGAFERQFGGWRSMDVMIKVFSPAQLNEARDELTGILRRVRHLAPADKDDFAINEQSLLTDLYRSLTAALYTTATLIGGISLLVGGIGIMNIMLVAVTERIREIGIRKAVGARRLHILGQFLLESIVVSSLGGVLGVLFGFLLSWVLDATTPLAAAVTPGGILLGLTFSMTVGVIFGVYPAARAAGLDPVEALAEGSM